MGLTLEFLVGNKREIINGISTENFDVMDKIDEAGLVSDFSLHITPSDLDYLFGIIGEKYRAESTSLRENLDTVDCFCDFPDRGAFYVHEKIKELIASIPLSDAAEIARNWYLELERVHPTEKMGESIDAKHAIEDLIKICKVASKENQDLVHWWCG